MMQDRAVALTVIACGTLVALGALGLLGWLTVSGYGSEALLSLVGTALLAYLKEIHGKVAQVKVITQAVLPTPAAPSDSEGEAPRNS